MKDIDFEELDQAVSSLMQKATTPAPAAPVSNTSNVPAVDTPASNDSTATLISEETAETAGSDALTSSSPMMDTPAETAGTSGLSASSVVAPKRSGRFMDVVHPSSDMSLPTKPAVQTAPKRHGMLTLNAPTSVEQVPKPSTEISSLAIDPIKPAEEAPTYRPDVPTDFEDTSTLTESHTEPAFESTGEPEDHVTTESIVETSASTWPDPLEVQPGVSSTTEEDVETKTDTAIDEATPETITDDSTPIEPPQSTYSPFIPDAKVDKRPLGGEPLPATEAEASSVLEATEITDEQHPEPSAILPQELQHDLMALESDETPQVTDAKDEPVTTEAVPSTPVERESVATVSASTVTQANPSTPATRRAVEHTVEPDKVEYTGPVSIPQQYQPEPSTGDQEHTPIYDTSSYAKPIEHPAKKKSGWLTVLIIVLLLLAGAGGAVALFMFNII